MSLNQLIKTAAQNILDDGQIPTEPILRKRLIDSYGVDYFTKRMKTGLNTFVGTYGLFDKRGAMEHVLDPDSNRLAFDKLFEFVSKRMYDSIKEGRCDTEWNIETWSVMSDEERLSLCSILVLLPICTKRCVSVPDNLPGLYIWGPPHIDKSAFFDNGIYLRKLSASSRGMSKFRLNATDSGFLLHDVPDNYLDRPDVSGPLLKLSLGGSAHISSAKSTDTIVGYVVATSESKPHFLLDLQPSKVKMDTVLWNQRQAAWRRRFIALELTETDDLPDCDPINVVWTDARLRDHAASLVVSFCDKLKDSRRELYDRYLRSIDTLLRRDYCIPDGLDMNHDP